MLEICRLALSGVRLQRPWRVNRKIHRSLSSRLPLSVNAPDVAAVRQGRKRLLATGDDTFAFACTACGQCCRSYADSVTIDPADHWRFGSARSKDPLRFAVGAFTLASLGIHVESQESNRAPRRRREGDAGFTPLDKRISGLAERTWDAESVVVPRTAAGKFAEMVIFHCVGLRSVAWSEELVQHLENSICGGRTGGVAPLAFLRTISEQPTAASDKLSRAQSHTSHGGMSQTSRQKSVPAAGGRRCVFAVPYASATDADAGAADGAIAVGSSGRLSCSLGPDRMPYTCSLFPLGEVWGERAASEPRQLRLVHSIDFGGCEGVVQSRSREIQQPGPLVAPSQASETTVSEYRAQRGLDERRALAERHRLLATLVAILAPDQTLAVAWDALLTSRRIETLERDAVAAVERALAFLRIDEACLGSAETPSAPALATLTPDALAASVQGRMRALWWPALTLADGSEAPRCSTCSEYIDIVERQTGDLIAASLAAADKIWGLCEVEDAPAVVERRSSRDRGRRVKR
jgi:hypothetical protein